MRHYRSNKRKNEEALLLDIELALGGEAGPPRYDTTAEPNLSVATLQQPDSVRTSGSNRPDGQSDTSGRRQNSYSLD